MGLFDWLGKGRRGAPVPPVARHVYREAADIVAEDGRGVTIWAPLSDARSRRVVPLTDAQQMGDQSVLPPLDALTAQMFSRVGPYTPAGEA